MERQPNDFDQDILNILYTEKVEKLDDEVEQSHKPDVDNFYWWEDEHTFI